TDFDGRFIYIDFSLDCVTCTRLIFQETEMNVFLTLNNFLFHLGIYLILCGDFNFIFNTKLDKTGGNPDKGCFGSKCFSSIIKTYGMTDVYRYKYPTKNGIIFCRNNIGFRLNRFYIPSKLKDDVFDTGILPCSMSDHDFIYVKLKLNNNISIGKSWKLNN
ncbi:hypothetical protein MAR_025572, partial [Mya arenaria]